MLDITLQLDCASALSNTPTFSPNVDITLQLDCASALSNTPTFSPNVDIAFVLIGLNPNINLSLLIVFVYPLFIKQ